MHAALSGFWKDFYLPSRPGDLLEELSFVCLIMRAFKMYPNEMLDPITLLQVCFF